MKRRLILILTVTIVLLSAGCLERHLENDYSRDMKGCCGNDNKINTPAGLIEYLNQQNLPALQSAELWQSRFTEGLKLTTAHYEIYTTLFDPLMLRDIPAFMETCYHSYQKQLPKPVETETKFAVYLFSNRTQWEIYTVFFTAEQAPEYTQIKAGAYYHNGSCIAYNIGRERTFRVLGHECWHQFADRLFKYRLPSWLNEGIAMQFEANRYENGLFYFEPERNLYRLGSLKKTLDANYKIALQELIAADPGQVFEQGTVFVSAFYSQSYALVRFLKQGCNGKYKDNLKKMLEDALKGGWTLNATNAMIASDRRIPLTVGWNQAVGPDLFKQYVETDFEKIENEFADFCTKIVQNVKLKPILIEQDYTPQTEKTAN
ncbi:hypothetical protein ES703_104406 [subsurface metagenome]